MKRRQGKRGRQVWALFMELGEDFWREFWSEKWINSCIIIDMDVCPPFL